MKRFKRLLGRLGLISMPKRPPDPAEDVDVRAIIAAGNEARGAGRWDLAIRQYALALAYAPDHAAVRVQLGHGLKELGRPGEAEAAYRAAIAVKPDDADIHLQLGHVLKLQGRQEEALAAYAEAVRRDPAFTPARDELIAAGGRNLLPDAQYGRSPMTDALADLSTALRSQQEALHRLVAVSTYPTEAYDAFRHAFPLQPPRPAATGPRPVTVIVDAEGANPGQIRLTLTSLIDQRTTDWRAIVRDGGAGADHPVASLARQDARITFAGTTADPLADVASEEGAILLCDAGLALDPEALGWFIMAADRTQADMVYADHDHHSHHWRRGRTYADPVFQSMADAWDLGGTPTPPAAVLVAMPPSDRARDAIRAELGASLRRRLLVEGLRNDHRVAHIPRVLSSLRVQSLDGEAATAPPPARAVPTPRHEDALVRVIIPTRDEPEILKACVDSLLARAARPDRLALQIVDNRSVAPETAELLEAYRTEGQVRVDRFDEPFNWARMNNVAAADGPTESILVFANNDVEMLTQDWDDRLRETLAGPDVGLIGTRLLYPDRKIQHAGVVLGVNDLRPVHEGLGRSDQEPGPNDRWIRPRQVAAVTGAFMALDQSVFDRLGGFNERLAVGYNDIDLCLRARAEGLAVLYEPAIELIHYESRTRGRADAAKVSWDDEELTDLHARWAGWMMFDPGKNPQWFSTHERAFDGLRNPAWSEIMRHLDLSARSGPWSIDMAIDPSADPLG